MNNHILTLVVLPLIILFANNSYVISQDEILKTDMGFMTPINITGVIGSDKSNSHKFLIDRAKTANIYCGWETGYLAIKLIDPDGNVYDSESQPKDFTLKHFEQRFQGMEDMSGVFSIYSLEDNYPTGQWSIEVSSIDPNIVEIKYSISLFYIEPELRTYTRINEEHPKTGEFITITTTVDRGGVPVIGARISANIVFEREIIDSLTLCDDGVQNDALPNDGCYAVEYMIPSKAGYYASNIQARKSDGIPFDRIDAISFIATSNKSTIGDVISEEAVDTDSDGLYNDFILSIEFNIEQEEYYELQARLYDSNNKLINNSRINKHLKPGNHILNFTFDGSKIYKRGIDGPYNLKSIVLSDASGNYDMQDYKENVYNTKAYGYRDFQHGPILLTQNYRLDELDVDSDGLFDSLVVEFEVDLLKEDYYRWRAQICNAENLKPIGRASGEGLIRSGLSHVRLSFSGADINKSDLDGPYSIWAVVINSETARLPYSNFRIKTRAYKYTDFE